MYVLVSVNMHVHIDCLIIIKCIYKVKIVKTLLMQTKHFHIC